jgi:deoxyhypusine synthase
MKAPREADLSAVRTIPVGRRPNKVSASEFAHPPAGDHSFAAFVDSLPDVLVARDFRAVVEAIANAATKKRAVIVMVGGHVVKTGLAPLLVDLMRRGVITHLAMNGSAAIHDYEIARFGATSEDVAAGLRDGTFGMAEETGREMNDAFVAGMNASHGMGETLGRALDARTDLANPELSVLLSAYRLGVPTSVHAALGAEIIHQHPAASGAAIGDTSHRDFRRLSASIVDLDDGGVVLNLGSAVIMPEVFLKALTIARNLNQGRPQNFVSVDLDMQRHYRPRMNVVQRPTLQSGKGYEITGHHEIMVPLLVWAVVDRLSQDR